MPDTPSPPPDTGRTPATVAVERMAKLASTGAEPDRVVTAVAAVVEEWLAEGQEEDVLRDRLEQLQADLDSGVDAAETAADDADTDGRRRAAVAQATALRAARDAVSLVVARLAG